MYSFNLTCLATNNLPASNDHYTPVWYVNQRTVGIKHASIAEHNSYCRH